MKKLIIIAILFISYSRDTMAQGITDNRERFQFGIRGGLNYANVYDAQGEEFNSDPKFGLVGGALLAIPLGKYIGFQPEVLYSQKGFTAQGKILGNPYSFTRTSSYIVSVRKRIKKKFFLLPKFSAPPNLHIFS